MWKTFAEQYRNDKMFRFAIDRLADEYGDKMAHAIKATALSTTKREDTFWERLAKKYRINALFRADIDRQADEYGDKMAHAIKATALAV